MQVSRRDDSYEVRAKKFDDATPDDDDEDDGNEDKKETQGGKSEKEAAASAKQSEVGMISLTYTMQSLMWKSNPLSLC
jgi:hypothetical protein